MIEQLAQVVELDGGRAQVRVGAATGCAACETGQGCGAGIFGRLLMRSPVLLWVDNSIAARCGDAVCVAIPEALFLRLLVRLYLLPLAAGLVGAGFGHHMALAAGAGPGPQDAAALAGALLVAWLALGLKPPQRIMRAAAGGVRLLRVEAAGPCLPLEPASAQAVNVSIPGKDEVQK